MWELAKFIMDKITIGQATLINGDCMELMRNTPDNYYQLSIVDPPYGIGDKFKGGETGKMNFNDIVNKGWDIAPTKEYFDELKRVSKNQIIWGGNYFNLPPTRCVIAWDKCQPWENFSQWEMAWTSFDKPAAFFSYSNIRNADKEPKIHPTQKPLALYLYLLNRFAKTGDKILDTHGGSFSSAIAANNLGFDFTGIELDADYYNAAVKRVSDANQQIRMFA